MEDMLLMDDKKNVKDENRRIWKWYKVLEDVGAVARKLGVSKVRVRRVVSNRLR